ncbi:hypothetical protein GCM10023087_02840 [Microbacterium rhizosphaerae]
MRREVGEELRLLPVRMKLDLVDDGRDAGVRQQPFEVLHPEVADADGADRPLLDLLLERLPGTEDVADGLVEQHQVDGAAVEPLERAGDGGARLVVAVVGRPDLRRQEDVVAWHSRRPDPAPDSALVAVEDGRVDEPVAVVQCGLDARLAHLHIGDEVDAEADLRHPHPVRERNARDHGCSVRVRCAVG